MNTKFILIFIRSPLNEDILLELLCCETMLGEKREGDNGLNWSKDDDKNDTATSDER